MKKISTYIIEKLKKISSKTVSHRVYDKVHIDFDNIKIYELKKIVEDEICKELCDEKKMFNTTIYSHEDICQLLKDKFDLKYEGIKKSKFNGKTYFYFHNDDFFIHIYPSFVHPEKHDKYYIHHYELDWMWVLK